MKMQKTLMALLLKMEDQEVDQFRKYATYKNKKILIKLFDFLLKNKNEEMDYGKIKNIRKQSTALYQLLLLFLNDNARQDEKSVRIDQLMHGSAVLINKGLFNEGLDIQQRAVELAQSGENFYINYEILRSSYYWSSILDLKNGIEILESNQKNEVLLKKKMKRFFDAGILRVNVYSKLINQKNNNKNELNQHFHRETIEKISKLLKDDDCSIKEKICYHDTLSGVYDISPKGEWEMVNYHRREIIRNAELNDEIDPNYFGQIIIITIINLLYEYFTVRKIPEFLIYLEKFRKLIKDQIEIHKTQEFYHHKIELINCNLLHRYEDAEKLYIPAALKFLKRSENKIPFGRFWAIFSLCFEHYISVGNLEKAAQLLEKMQQEGKQSELHSFQRYVTRLYELLYHYELNNFEFVDNYIESTRRLYSSYLQKNKGGKIILKYFLKLSRAQNEKSRISIYHSFKNELEETSKHYHYARNIGMDIIFDWIDTKIHKFTTIQAYITATSD